MSDDKNQSSEQNSDQTNKKQDLNLKKVSFVIGGGFVGFAIFWFLFGSGLLSGSYGVSQESGDQIDQRAQILNTDNLGANSDLLNDDIATGQIPQLDLRQLVFSQGESDETKVAISESLTWLSKQLAACIESRGLQADPELPGMTELLKASDKQQNQKDFWSTVFSVYGDKPSRQIENIHVHDAEGRSIRLHIIPEERINGSTDAPVSYQFLFFTEDEENLPVPTKPPFSLAGLNEKEITTKFLQMGKAVFQEVSFSSLFRFSKDGPPVPVQWNLKDGRLESFQIFYGSMSFACQNGCRCL